MTTARYATALTGGAAGALDAKAVGTLADGDICWVLTGSVLYVYKFVAAATDAESSPSKIRPDDYATAGVWYLQNVSADYSQMVRNDIDGGDATISGQVVTLTPTRCWDSAREVWLETLINKTVTVGTDINQTYYIFLVKLASDGSCEFRSYTTYAGVASDAAVSSYRFIDYVLNNGSGVARPFFTVSGVKRFIPTVVCASLTANTATSIDFSSFVPTDYISEYEVKTENAGGDHGVAYIKDYANSTTLDYSVMGAAKAMLHEAKCYAFCFGSSAGLYLVSTKLKR